MLKNIKLNFLIGFLLLCLITLFIMKTTSANTNVLSGSFDEIFLETNQNCVFWADYYVDFTVMSGTWNGSNGQITVTRDTGYLTFTSENNCSLYIETVSDRTFSVQASSATLTKTEGNYSAIITSGPEVTISWRFLPWSMVDSYFLLGIGLTGIIMMIAGPIMFARTFIKHGLDSDSVQWLGYAMLFVILGFGFVVVWLWPG